MNLQQVLGPLLGTEINQKEFIKSDNILTNDLRKKKVINHKKRIGLYAVQKQAREKVITKERKKER